MRSSRTSNGGHRGAIRLGPGTLYEAIQRLEDGGLIEESARLRDAEPANGQEAQRRYYQLTERGWTSLRDELQQSGALVDAGESQSAAQEGPRVMRLYEALLWCYPAGFRRRYRAELLATFESVRSEPQHRGVGGTAAFWIHIVRDVMASAGRQRTRQVRERLREATGGGAPAPPQHPKRSEMDTLIQDARYALRQFVRRPAFAAVAVLSLALAIGGNAAIYGLLDGFVFHPFPYPEPDRLVSVGVTFPKLSSDIDVCRSAVAGRIRRHSQEPQLLAHRRVRSRQSQRLRRRRAGTRVHGAPARRSVSGHRDDAGARPRLHARRAGSERTAGRDHQPPALAEPIRRRSGHPEPSDPHRRPSASIVGVMPPGLVLIGTDLWIPWGGDPPRCRATFVSSRSWRASRRARRSPQANAELATIAGAVEQAERPRFAEYEGWRLHGHAVGRGAPAGRPRRCVHPARRRRTRPADRLRQPHQPVAGAIDDAASRAGGAAGARRGALADRASSADRERACCRSPAGWAAWRSPTSALKGSSAHHSRAVPDARLERRPQRARALWSLALAIVAGLLVGFLPALQATRTDPHDSLKGRARRVLRAAGGCGRRSSSRRSRCRSCCSSAPAC